jgi:hypothetical protein
MYNIAAQLAESAGNPALYDHVKESDKKGVSPGSVTLKNPFGQVLVPAWPGLFHF